MIKDQGSFAWEEDRLGDRRQVLRLLGRGGVVAAGAVASLAAGTPAASATTHEEGQTGPHRETAHQRAYYDSARF